MQTLNQNHSRVVWDYLPTATGAGVLTYAIYANTFTSETISQIACGAIATVLSSGLIGATPILAQLGIQGAGIEAGMLSGLIILSARTVAGPVIQNAVLVSAVAATSAALTTLLTGPTPHIQRQGT